MKKSELVEVMAKAGGISKTDAKKALDSALSAIASALKKGEKVTLIGFGTFSTIKRAARQGRNPQTGKAMVIKRCMVAKFKAGDKLATTLADKTNDTGPEAAK